MIDFDGYKVFEGQTVDTNIIVVENSKYKGKLMAIEVSDGFTEKTNIKRYFKKNGLKVKQLSEEKWIIGTKGEMSLKNKVESDRTRALEDWKVSIHRGITTGSNKAFVISQDKREELISTDTKNEEIIEPLLRGRDIDRYHYNWKQRYLINTHNGYDSTGNGVKDVKPVEVKEDYPEIWKYLKRINKKSDGSLESRYDQGDHWTNLRNCAYLEEFSQKKLIFTKASKEQAFAIDSEGFYLLNTSYMITGSYIEYLAGVLNSSLARYLFLTFYQGGGIEGEITVQAVKKIPIPKINDSNKSTIIRIEELVQKILEKKNSRSDIDTLGLEEKIDELVFELYNLDSEEKKLVKNGIK